MAERPVAGVARDGGLCFAVGVPWERAGEFVLVSVLDGEFRYLLDVTS